jgi:cytoskeletal protein CcmA (bactofilin family)
MSKNGAGGQVVVGSQPIKKTVVEEGSELRGTLSAATPVAVHGKVDGEVTAPALEIAATGVLTGRARVGELRSRGELAGEFDADAATLGGVVRKGTVIRAKTLSVEAGEAEEPATIFEGCALEIGEAPSKELAVSAAIAASKPPAPEAQAAAEASAEGSEAPKGVASVEAARVDDAEMPKTASAAPEPSRGAGKNATKEGASDATTDATKGALKEAARASTAEAAKDGGKSATPSESKADGKAKTDEPGKGAEPAKVKDVGPAAQATAGKEPTAPRPV